MGPAREKVRVARALADLPKISMAFREGKVSYSKVRAMTRVATDKNEEALRHAHRALGWYVDDDDSWLFKGRFTAEQGVLIKKALEAAADQLFEEQQNVPGKVSAGTSWLLRQLTVKMAWILPR